MCSHLRGMCLEELECAVELMYSDNARTAWDGTNVESVQARTMSLLTATRHIVAYTDYEKSPAISGRSHTLMSLTIKVPRKGKMSPTVPSPSLTLYSSLILTAPYYRLLNRSLSVASLTEEG